MLIFSECHSNMIIKKEIQLPHKNNKNWMNNKVNVYYE